MPLSPPIAREPLHTRKVTCKGYFRSDGHWDIEGHITDEKSYDHENEFRGPLRPGDFVHEMWIRLTLDRKMTVTAVESSIDHHPYRPCPSINPNFQRLVGLRIGEGFHKAVRERLGGIQGCTHLVELLGPVATTAFQTVGARRSQALYKDWADKNLPPKTEAKEPRGDRPRRHPVLDTCHAWASDGEVAKRWAPDFYTGPKDGAPEASTKA
ncbi:MAG: DUF2889 domain-containing protein [Alphaproteobacteria bacterium]|nr:DUF2889 domain-containing protein [Alphaproteobacteria bacterium]